MPAYLIDNAKDIDPSWFQGDETVLVTAGASAPELMVEDCISFLRQRYQATVEVQIVREEDVHFPLPRELRTAMSAPMPARGKPVKTRIGDIRFIDDSDPSP